MLEILFFPILYTNKSKLKSHYSQMYWLKKVEQLLWIMDILLHVIFCLWIKQSKHTFNMYQTWQNYLSEQRQMIEIKSTIASCSQANVNDMVCTRNKANKAGYKEHDSLWGVYRIRNSVDSHHDQGGSNDQKHKSGQHSSPILAHLRMAPTVGVNVGSREVTVFLNKWVAVTGRRVVGILEGPVTHT